MVGLPFCHRPPCLRREFVEHVNKQEPTTRGYSARKHANSRIEAHDATKTARSVNVDGSHERARSAFGAGLSSWTIDRNASATDEAYPSPRRSKETRRERFPRFGMNALHEERGHVRSPVGQSRSAIPEGRDPGLGLAGAPFNVFGCAGPLQSRARARAHLDYIIFSSRINFPRKAARASAFIFARQLDAAKIARP